MSLTTNLLAYWKLDESSGNAADASGGGHTMTISGATYGAAKINNGAIFANTGDIFSSNSTDFNFERTQAFSVSFWVIRGTTRGAAQMFAVCRQTVGGTGQGWRVNHQGSGDSNRIYFVLANNAGGSNMIMMQSPANIAHIGSWDHIVATYDGSSDASGVHIYINGSDQSLNTLFNNLSASSQVSTDLKFNNRETNDSVDATMDEIGIWTRVLTGAEVTSLYNSGNGLQYPFVTSAIKTINGLAIASVKTVMGLAIASVKTWCGLA